VGGERRHPPGDPVVIDVRGMAERQKHVHVEQRGHGKSASSARICSEETGGTVDGAFMTGSPVTGSSRIRYPSSGTMAELVMARRRRNSETVRPSRRANSRIRAASRF